MRVFDLVAGFETDLPSEVESGRYCILVDSTLNDCIEVVAGAILWCPGTSRCDLLARGGDVVERHTFIGSTLEQDDDQDLVVRAVQAVIDECEECGLYERPSPVMPGKLKEQAELTALEQRLIKDVPYLFNIERLPRMSMRYDAELTSTARVRRLASGALVRLASRSEDWNRRDFKGVSPKRLLAEVSEDELGIYENVVYARLLDRLCAHLRSRVRTLRTLEARRTDADEIANAESLDYRLRYRLCDLWGAAYPQEAESSSTGTGVLAELITLMKKMMRLRLGHLYLAIPSGVKVPQVLRTTNVLLHDQNYKRLRPLWAMAHAVGSTQAQSGKLQIEVVHRQYQQFRKYVSLLIEHALSSSNLLTHGKEPAEHKFGEWPLICTESARGELQLELMSDTLGECGPLTFVPVWRGQGEWLSGGGGRQVVFCHASTAASEDELKWGSGEDSVLNPLQFYSVERVRARIEGWLIAYLASAYPMTVSPWPHTSTQELCAAFPGAFLVDGRGLCVLKPVPTHTQEQLDSLIRVAKANDNAIFSMRGALQLAKLMSTCKVCGDVVAPEKIQADSRAFKAACECGFSWKWRFEGNSTRRQGTYAYGDEPRTFEVVGSDELRVILC